MDSTNKIISFVLGLVVVIVFLAIITGKLNLKNVKLLPLSKGTMPTITTTPTPKATSLKTISEESQTVQTETYHNYQPSQIPATGVPTIFLPLALSGFLGGIYLRKRK